MCSPADPDMLDHPHLAGDRSEAETAAACRRIASGELFGSRRELEILHNKCIYRLRVTSAGKLILTK